MNKKILQLALPSIVSNITVPLLGLVDVAIVGHLGAASYIGAIAVGGMLFNIIYWLFGFLRMGTSGMTSQALGRRDLLEVTRVLFRSVGVGILISLALLLLQYPIREIAFLLFVFGAHRLCWDCMASPVGLSECRIPVFRCLLRSPRMS